MKAVYIILIILAIGATILLSLQKEWIAAFWSLMTAIWCSSSFYYDIRLDQLENDYRDYVNRASKLRW